MSDTLKEQLQKKTLLEIESMIMDHRQKIGAEKNLATLHRLTTELSVLQDVRNQKQSESGRLVNKNVKTQTKTDLKSYDDYMKSKK